MTNRPKNIGTAAETAIVRAARTRGFPLADRLTLTGHLDRGDIGLAPGVIIEVKAGEAAKTASDAQIETWLNETNREATNANADIAFLVTARRGVGPTNAHRWWAWFRLSWLEHLRGHDTDPDNFTAAPVRILLDDALQLIRAAGYGNPLNTTEQDSAADVLGLPRAREGVA